jgi:hypothetical protein
MVNLMMLSVAQSLYSRMIGFHELETTWKKEIIYGVRGTMLDDACWL